MSNLRNPYFLFLRVGGDQDEKWGHRLKLVGLQTASSIMSRYWINGLNRWCRLGCRTGMCRALNVYTLWLNCGKGWFLPPPSGIKSRDWAIKQHLRAYMMTTTWSKHTRTHRMCRHRKNQFWRCLKQKPTFQFYHVRTGNFLERKGWTKRHFPVLIKKFPVRPIEFFARSLMRNHTFQFLHPFGDYNI